MSPDFHTILRGVMAGDVQAQTAFYERFRPQLQLMLATTFPANRVHGLSDMEQSAFWRLFEAVQNGKVQIDDESHAIALLFRYARHRGIDNKRKERVRDDALEDVHAVKQLNHSQKSAAELLAERELVEHYRNALSNDDRQIIDMRLSEGLSFEEIAERLSIHVETARKRYYRIIHRLRSQPSCE